MIKLPGLIDPHVHLRDPGQTEKEDFFTGTAAALSGGFTTVLDMPNNKTPITTNDALEEKIKVAKEKILCDVGFYFGSLGDNLEEFKKVKDKTYGLKLYLNHTTGNYLLDSRKLETIFTAWPENSPILLHAEEETFGLVLEIFKKHPRPIHLCHVSSSYELKRVIEAKEKNRPVTCGVTPHHLFLTEENAQSLGPFGMMKPALKNQKEVDFLWKNLRAIDCIESDHAPHTLLEKQSPNPPFGVPNLETTLPLLLTAVHENKLTIEDIIRLCYEGPKNIFFKRTGYAENQNEVTVDMNQSWEIKNEDLFTKAAWSPFNRWKVKGKVVSVRLRNKKVFENGKILVQAGYGKLLPLSM